VLIIFYRILSLFHESMKNISSNREKRGDSFFMLILFVFMFSVFSSAAFPSIDSTSSADTSRYYTPIFYHGSYIIRQDSSRIISKKNIRPSTQFGITDVLHNTFSSIPLSLGGLSLNNSVSIYGNRII